MVRVRTVLVSLSLLSNNAFPSFRISRIRNNPLSRVSLSYSALSGSDQITAQTGCSKQMASQCASKKSGAAVATTILTRPEPVPEISRKSNHTKQSITGGNILEQHHALEPVLAINELENDKGDTSTAADVETNWYDGEWEPDGGFIDDDERKMFESIDWGNPVFVKPLPGESFMDTMKRTMAELAASTV